MTRSLLRASIALAGCLLLCRSATIFGADDFVVYQTRHTGLQQLYSLPRQLVFTEANMWNPAKDQLPVDIGSYVEKGRKHLISTKKPDKELKLFGFWMSQNPDRKRPHEGPWYFVFRYGHQVGHGISRRTLPDQYFVVMLLDGTIARETTTPITR